MTGGQATETHRHNSRGQDFRPATRGDLRKALAERNGMALIAPQSPRPAQMLASLLAAPGEALTHDDLKLYELLVSLAHADDAEMPDAYVQVDIQEIIKYLGNRTRREDVRRAFRRLKQTDLAFHGHGGKRLYEGVSLIHGWHRIEGDEDVIEFQLPAPIREALAAKSRYAYVELAALPAMRSKYSIALYRQLAAMTSDKRWVPGGVNRTSVSFTPERLAQAIGFPVGPDGRVHGGKLRKQVLDRIMPKFDEKTGDHLPTDFDAVRNFSVEVRVIDNPKKRGRPIEQINFTVVLAMPQLRHDRWISHRRKPEPGERRIGAADCPEYRVSASLWRRAYRAYRHHLHMGAREMHELWIIALDEALEKMPLTREWNRRKARRVLLLDIIKRDGADEAAWQFITEEADYPDLAPCDLHDYDEHRARYAAADRRRRARVDWDEMRASKKRATRERLKTEAPPVAPPAPVRRPPPPRSAILAPKTAVETPMPPPAVRFVPHFDSDGYPTHVTIEGEYELISGDLPPKIVAIIPEHAKTGMLIPVKFGGRTISYRKKRAPVLRDAEGNPRRHPMDEDGARFAKLTRSEKMNEVHSFQLGLAPSHGTSEDEIAARPAGYGDLPEAQTPPAPGSYPVAPAEPAREKIHRRVPVPFGFTPAKAPVSDFAVVDDDCPF